MKREQSPDSPQQTTPTEAENGILPGRRQEPDVVQQGTPIEDVVTEASEESFPASDPPFWSPGHA